MSIVQKLLEYAAQIKLYHWSTQSHSRHIASDKLYSDLQSGMDRFVEVYIGIYGRDAVLTNGTAALKIYNDEQANVLLDDIAKFLKEEVPKHVSDTDLLNIRDELLASINNTKYLFTQDSPVKYSKMLGGTIFDMSFKMPITSFLYALLIMLVISMFLGLITMSLFGVAWIAGVADNTYVAAAIAIAYAVISLYAPLDYIYTMGLNAK